MQTKQAAAEEGIVITVIDNSDYAGQTAARMWGDWGTRIFVTRSPSEMVTKILALLKSKNDFWDGISATTTRLNRVAR